MKRTLLTGLAAVATFTAAAGPIPAELSMRGAAFAVAWQQQSAATTSP